jgi:hypothetical protein
MAIASLTDQGSGRKRIDPKIVAARRAAKERLHNLLSEMRARGETPEWRLRNKVQLLLTEGETVLEPVTVGPDRRPQPVEIAYLGAPNLAMEPINEAAHRIFALYCEATGSGPSQDRPGWAMTRSGVVVQGRAAASIINRDARRSGEPAPPFAASEQQFPHAAAVIRRNGHSDVVETRILGSLAEPARQTP